MYSIIRNGAKLAAMAAICFGTTALAGNVHLSGGKNAEPVFRDVGMALEADFTLAGLGSGDALVILEAEADQVIGCVNPGGNIAEGHIYRTDVVSGSRTIFDGEIRNGKAAISVATIAPGPFDIEGPVDCPNSNWTARLLDLVFKSATIVVEQPLGTEALVLQCTFDPATGNGAVPGSDVTCE